MESTFTMNTDLAIQNCAIGAIVEDNIHLDHNVFLFQDDNMINTRANKLLKTQKLADRHP